MQVWPGVESNLLLVIRGFGEQLDAVSDLKADPAKQSVAVVLWIQTNATARIIDLPRSALRQRRRGGARRRGESQCPIDELIDRPAIGKI